jgi:ABC-type nitrate/sulfonate/bicarbonate transport system ATPase subunit
MVDEVSRAYPGRDGTRVQALADISLHAAAGELLAVVGPSGCGKSTLLELICDLQTPDAGSIECAPAVLMPQRDLLLPWLCALDNAALALRIAHVPRAETRARAGELFAELGLAGFEQARPYELSGGMRQRVAFVRTLLSGKQLLCLDEPFGALDAITRAEMHTWLADALAREPRTVVLVTHDVEEAIVLADRVAVLSPRPGHVVEELEVSLERPRGRTDPEVVALRERALIALAHGKARDEA